MPPETLAEPGQARVIARVALTAVLPAQAQLAVPAPVSMATTPPAVQVGVGSPRPFVKVASIRTLVTTLGPLFLTVWTWLTAVPASTYGGATVLTDCRLPSAVDSAQRACREVHGDDRLGLERGARGAMDETFWPTCTALVPSSLMQHGGVVGGEPGGLEHDVGREGTDRDRAERQYAGRDRVGAAERASRRSLRWC